MLHILVTMLFQKFMNYRMVSFSRIRVTTYFVPDHMHVYIVSHVKTLCLLQNLQDFNTYHADSSSQTFSGYSPYKRKIKVRKVWQYMKLYKILALNQFQK